MILSKSKHYCQQPFGKIANFVVNSRLRSARNIILVENKRFRSSQPRQAAERCVSAYDDTAVQTN